MTLGAGHDPRVGPPRQHALTGLVGDQLRMMDAAEFQLRMSHPGHRREQQHDDPGQGSVHGQGQLALPAPAEASARPCDARRHGGCRHVMCQWLTLRQFRLYLVHRSMLQRTTTIQRYEMITRIEKLARDVRAEYGTIATRTIKRIRAATLDTADMIDGSRKPVRKITEAGLRINRISSKGVEKLVKQQATFVDSAIEAGAHRLELAARADSFRALIGDQISMLPNARHWAVLNARKTIAIVKDTGDEIGGVLRTTVAATDHDPQAGRKEGRDQGPSRRAEKGRGEEACGEKSGWSQDRWQEEVHPGDFAQARQQDQGGCLKGTTGYIDGSGGPLLRASFFARSTDVEPIRMR